MIDVSYKPGEIKGKNDGSVEDSLGCYQRLGKGVTDRLRRGVNYAKNSSVGKFLGNVKDEFNLSIYLTKEAFKDPETKHLWIKNHIINNIPEILTAVFLTTYGYFDARYYSDPLLSKLAAKGLTTNGTYVSDRVSFPLLTFKPFITPAYIPRTLIDRNGNIPSKYTRPLTPFENDYDWFAACTLPADVKYGIKVIEHFEKNKK